MCYQLHQLANLENITSKKGKMPPVPKFLSIPTPLSDLENTVIWYSLHLLFSLKLPLIFNSVVPWHQINLNLIETKCQWLFWFRLKQPFAKSTAHNVNHTNWKFWVSRKCKYNRKIKDERGLWKKVKQMQPITLVKRESQYFPVTRRNWI